MTLSRCGGVLLHPTSLPGRCGIGDLGKNAHRFVDFLHRAGLNLWQILPLSPTGYGNSPYQALSTFAGNPLWISLEKLVEDELLAPGDLNHAADFPALKVDFAKVTAFHSAITTRAFEKYSSSARHSLKAAFETFCHNNHNWLEEYALFRALKSIHKECAWVEWPIELVHRKPSALNVAADKLAREIETIKFQQFLFFRQWDELRAYAKEKGVRIVGDVPIFVAHDSVDVWTNQHLFHLDKTGRPTHVAGVPPDYFSETGQLWGNPLYDWRKMSEDNYAWWVSRMKSLFSLVDIIRLDHFRGFEAYWSVPAEEETAINGQWLKGPGFEFFDELVAQIGELPIIAEDLGVITEEVEALRDHYGFPGMKVLQFAFGDTDAANAFLPYNYERNCVVYTGTHDNDATISWLSLIHI